MADKKIRPEIEDSDIDVESFDEIILGFPIWWYVAPTIVNTFLENTILTAKNSSFRNLRRKRLRQYGK